MEKFKAIFVGSRVVGKTSLLLTYYEKKLPEKYIPTIFDIFQKTFKIEKNKEIEISFWDSERPEDRDRLFPLIYPETDLIAICFSIIDSNSFERIENFWIPEIEQYSPNSKRILIGTKIDLRNELKEDNQKLITKEEGMEFAKKIKAIKYFECSSFTQKGIETIFNEIPLVCIGKYDKEENKKGCILN